MKRLQDQRLMRRARRLRRQRSGTPTSFSLPSEINRTLPASDMVASASLNLSVIATYFSDDSAEDEGTSTTTSFAPITVVNARTFLQTDTDAARIMRFQLEDKVFDQRMASLDQQQNEADNAFDQLEKAQRSACSALIYTRDTQVTRYAGFTGYFNPEYVQIDRIIFECLADGRQVAISASASQQETTHYLVKWQSQSYAQATWESVQTFSQLPNSAAAIQSYRAVLGACSTTATTFDQVKTAQSTRRMMARPPYTGDEVFKGGKKLLPYQISGSNWLALNYHQHRNSLLADEMGLGKTVQSIMFLKYLRTTAPESGLFLVVAPLSTMQHWRREIESFTDDMYAVVYHGSAEDRAVLREREWNVYNQQNEVVEGATRFQVQFSFSSFCVETH
jgi:chromodomain-helicase-DNA-binding protein 7